MKHTYFVFHDGLFKEVPKAVYDYHGSSYEASSTDYFVYCAKTLIQGDVFMMHFLTKDEDQVPPSFPRLSLN